MRILGPAKFALSLGFLSLLTFALSGCGSLPTNGYMPPSGGGGGGGGTTTPTLSTSIDHIIFIAQENRSFDHYFGALRQYWAQNGYPDQSFDGLPQFNPTTGATPLAGPAPTNPGCNANQPPPADCAYDTSNPITSYHLVTQCIENPSPSWNEGHIDWDYNDPTGQSPAALNGFVYSAAHDARNNDPPYYDTDGRRAMGYYDGTDLNYYYWMASNFGTSDRFFNPALSRTQTNREYLVAGTSAGYVYPEGTDANDSSQLKQTTIFQELQSAGISWKIYVDPTNSGCTGPPYQASCLIQLSYINDFTFANTIVSQYPNNIAPVSQYFTDLQNGTLPQVAQFEPATDAGLDEHPSVERFVAVQYSVGSSIYRVARQRAHAEPVLAELGLYSYLRRKRGSLRSCFAAAGGEPGWYQAGGYVAGRYLHHRHWTNLRFRVHRLPRSTHRDFALREEELRGPHRCRYHGDSEVD